MDDEQLLTITDVAEYLRVSVGTVRGWRARGQGPRGYRVGKHVRYSPTEVRRWLDGRADDVRAAS